MDNLGDHIVGYGIWAVAAIVLIILIRMANVIRYIPNNQVGIVEKLWAARGSVKSGFIALHGEAGFQPDILRGGIHFFLPFMYSIHKSDLVTVGQGRIAYVFARDGAPLAPSQVLAANDTPEKAEFQNVRDFLVSGGQKGPQRKVLREGTYAINTTQFAIITDERVFGHALTPQEQRVLDGMKQTLKERGGFVPVVIADADDSVGIVTVHDGPSLPPGEIIAPEVGSDRADADTFHNNFQEPEKFLHAGGYRGRQLQALVDGTWYVNRLFATVELVPKTVIPVGNVGVVVFYTGPHTADVSGEEYRHGELVTNGSRRVWKDPLLPGKYAFNTYAGKVDPDGQLHPQMDAGRSRRHEARRESVGDFAHHQGRLRADTAFIGGDAYRLQESADDHPALRRRKETRRADARSDGQRLFQEYRPEDDPD
jgi:uncharacterized membrane protein YqiK